MADASADKKIRERCRRSHATGARFGAPFEIAARFENEFKESLRRIISGEPVPPAILTDDQWSRIAMALGRCGCDQRMMRSLIDLILDAYNKGMTVARANRELQRNNAPLYRRGAKLGRDLAYFISGLYLEPSRSIGRQKFCDNLLEKARRFEAAAAPFAISNPRTQALGALMELWRLSGHTTIGGENGPCCRFLVEAFSAVGQITAESARDFARAEIDPRRKQRRGAGAPDSWRKGALWTPVDNPVDNFGVHAIKK